MNTITDIYALALSVWEGDRKVAADWLQKPNVALGGDSPASLLTTERGRRTVENLLLRIGTGFRFSWPEKFFAEKRSSLNSHPLYR
jgi:putative toxin-antitoxin system antitoxin component (TIGR02293 family)